MANLNPVYRIYKLFEAKSTVPRWLIFILDIHICAFALFFAYWLRFNMDLSVINEHGFIFPILFITFLNVVFFRIFRTYAGIIRLSGAEEGIRCVLAVFCSCFVLLISLAISAIFNFPYLVPTSVLIIYFFTASFLIFAYRIWVKQIYNRILKGKFTGSNVLIYGKSINHALLKNAIESIANSEYKVIGFIDNDKNRSGKSIDNANIYSFEQLMYATRKHKVKYLFMTDDDPDIEMKNRIVEYCLAENISVKVIPMIKKWLNGHLQTNQLKNLKIESLLGRPDIKLASQHIQKALQPKRILITGAAGSIGSEIVKQLLGIDVELIILCDNRETGLYDLQNQIEQTPGIKENLKVCITDVRNKEAMENLFRTFRPQIVFHAAAYKHVPLMEMQPCEAVNNNVLGTRIVADLSVVYNAERFVLISSDKAVNPTNVMGATKRIAEMYVGKLQSSQYEIQKNDNWIADDNGLKESFIIRERTKFIITRFGNVLGSNGSVIPLFQKQIDEGGPVTVTHPDIIRYFMTIPEACSLVLEACTMGKGGEIFVFDMGKPVKIVDLANKMIKLAGLEPGRDIQMEFTGLRPGEKLYEELLNKNEEVIPTHHEKIMISKVDKSSFSAIVRNVDLLLQLAEKINNMQVVKQMKLMVTEYKSKNSAYESLDRTEKALK